MGAQVTLTTLRGRFWIPKGMQTVKSQLRTCVICRKHHGHPYAQPVSPPLPKIRVQQAPPFAVTGVDIIAALNIKTANGTSKSAYICLFTCAVTRAVSLELVPDMSTASFLDAFRRFSARRGLLSFVVSGKCNHLHCRRQTPVERDVVS